MGFWNNVLNVLEFTQAALTVNQVNEWLNEKVIELRKDSTKMSAMVEIARFVGSLNQEGWNTFIAGVGLKAIGNHEVANIKQYCEQVVQIETREFRQLLQMDLSSAKHLLLQIVERNPLQRCIYIGLLLSRDRDVVASYLLNAIVDAANRHEPLPQKIASGKIHKVWLEHNIYEGRDKGMYIHMDITINNSVQDPCRVIAWYYHSDGRRLEDINGQYNTSDGQVCTYKDFVPPYEGSHYEDLKMFMPYSEFDISVPGQYKLKTFVGLFNRRDRLDASEYVFIDFNLS